MHLKQRKTVTEMAFSPVSDKRDGSNRKTGCTEKYVDPLLGRSSPYCEEVGVIGKVRVLGWSGKRGEGIPSLAHHTEFVLYQHNPRMPPADFPSALALPLMAAGVSSPHPSLPRMATMDWRAETVLVSKISSTSNFNCSALLSPFDLSVIVPRTWYADVCTLPRTHMQHMHVYLL